LFFDVRIGTILAFNFFNQPKCPAMKKCILGIFAFISVHTIHAQVSKNLKSADLSSFLLQSQTDEILKKERDCALMIHDLINEHRESNRKQPLLWNDTLWLAARNHSHFLSQNSLFQHHQVRGKDHFTGIDHNNRIQYVLGQEPSLNTSGENLFSTGYAFSNPHLAKLAFEAWKNSSGHNKNMLNNDYKLHGVAVFIGDKGVIITDVLSSNFIQFNAPIYAKNESSLMISEATEARPADRLLNQTKSSEAKSFSTTNMKKELGNVFYYLKVKEQLPSGMKREERLNQLAEKTALDKLQKFISNRQLLKSIYNTDFYKESQSEATAGNVFQRIFNNHKNQSIEVILAFDGSKYNADLVSSTVYSYWKDRMLEVLPNASKYGYFIGLKKKSNHFIVSAVLHLQS